MADGVQLKQLDWNLLIHDALHILSFDHVSDAKEELVIELFGLAGLLLYALEQLAHGHDWKTQVNGHSKIGKKRASRHYLRIISSWKQLSCDMKAILGLLGQRLMKPLS